MTKQIDWEKVIKCLDEAQKLHPPLKVGENAFKINPIYICLEHVISALQQGLKEDDHVA